MNIEKRFWSKVDIKGENDCWPWKGCTISKGYGQIWYFGRMRNAHRIAWELRHNKVLGELFCLHTCDNPICVNPNHLVAGTHADNMKDMADKSRASRHLASKSHCRNGHEYTEKNVYTTSKGYRQCRACQSEAKRKWEQEYKRKGSP